MSRGLYVLSSARYLAIISKARHDKDWTSFAQLAELMGVSRCRRKKVLGKRNMKSSGESPISESGVRMSGLAVL